MDRSRILIVYFSRTGTTRAVARAIQKELHCEIHGLVDRTPREGAGGYVRSVVDALFDPLFGFDRPADLLPLSCSLSDYDLVLVGGPIWNGSAATPIRTFLSQHRDELHHVAFFSTYAGTDSARALRTMADLAGKDPLLTLALRRAEVEEHVIEAKVRTYSFALMNRVHHEERLLEAARAAEEADEAAEEAAEAEDAAA